jgi:tetratricopeptide (TPR) repeat protein
MSDDILTRLQKANNDDEREWLTMQYTLDNLPSDVQDAVWAAAIPHWFDGDFLSALLDHSDFDDTPEYKALLELSFVEPFQNYGYNIHERSRKLLLNRLWYERRAHYQELSKRAVGHCVNQDQDESTWRMETIYHLLIADPDSGATLMQNTGWEWQNSPNFAYDRVEAMVRLVREHADSNRLNRRGLGWTLFWEAHIDQLYDRSFRAKELLIGIKIDPEYDQSLAVSVDKALGDVHMNLSEYDEARQRYEQALPIYQDIGARVGEANCIKSLGDVHRMLSEYDEARQRYEQALPIYQDIGARVGEANCIKSLGDVHYMVDEYDEARQRYEQVVQITPDNTGARITLAGLLRRLGLETEKEEQLSIIRERIDGESEYNRACFESVCGNLGEAFAMLASAFNNDPNLREWARRDPDLDFIRDDQRFKKLFGE